MAQRYYAIMDIHPSRPVDIGDLMKVFNATDKKNLQTIMESILEDANRKPQESINSYEPRKRQRNTQYKNSLQRVIDLLSSN
jgi:hypothetical protein